MSAIGYPILFTVIVIAVWAIAAKAGDNEFVLPSPLSAFKKAVALLGEKSTYVAFGNTILRALVAWLVSVAGAVVLAAASAAFRPLGKLLSPLVSVVRALPTMSVVLLLLVWTNARVAPVVVAVLVVLPTAYSAIASAISSVDGNLVEACKAYDVPRKRVLTQIYLPLVARAARLPISSSLSLTLKLTVAAEVLASTARSLGGLMQTSKLYYETAALMALTVLTVAAAMLLEAVVNRLFLLFFKEERA